jgi:hypothetical protein
MIFVIAFTLLFFMVFPPWWYRTLIGLVFVPLFAYFFISGLIFIIIGNRKKKKMI